MASMHAQSRPLFNGAAAYQVQTVGSAVRQPQRRTLPQERPQRRAVEQPRALSMPMTVLCILGAVCVMVILIFAHMRLYAITSENSAMRTELTELEAQRAKLQGQYNGMINYREIETEATTRLGMAKPNGSQTVYVNLAGSDRGEVLGGEDVFGWTAELFSDAFSNLSAYLSAPAT